MDIKKIRGILREHLNDSYRCSRVWDAWNLGTMTSDDFESLGGDDYLIDEIANDIMNLEEV